MKNATTIVLVLLALTCAAQIEPRFTIGSKIGFGHAYLAPHGGGFNGSWMVGLTSAYMTGERLGFGADALYSAEGGRLPLVDGTEGDVDINYFRVPLRVIYAFGNATDAFRPRVAAGPSFGINMGEGTGFRDMDFGLNGLAGFNYLLADGLWMGVDAIYYHGLMDVNTATATHDRNGSIRLAVSITFGI